MFNWWVNNGPLSVVFGYSLPSSIKNNLDQRMFDLILLFLYVRFTYHYHVLSIYDIASSALINTKGNQAFVDKAT